MVFSDRARRDLQDGSRVFTVTGGNQQAIKDVLDWIVQCKEEGKAAMFQTVSTSLCCCSTTPDMLVV